ncbi:hypothetical protein [Pseudomonas sp. StFLB209]|uniref:hypothetical protein n=1 Tax=Pseudomonas sp. StFLB209 TaxID=1028989 RepID=UPI00118561D9|nr:hypothetical protein [Pseudomonas sp. StFLB209]
MLPFDSQKKILMGTIYFGFMRPFLVNIFLEFYIRYFCLTDMLAALKRNSLFSFVDGRNPGHQGRLFKTLLLTDIGTALIFSRSNVRNGACLRP